MSGPVIALVVEGEGEVAAAPVLVRRIAYQLELWDVAIPRPMRAPRSGLVKVGGIEQAVQRQAVHVAGSPGGVLVLLDADDDCPHKLGPELLQRAKSACPAVAVSVVLPSREYESWFIAAASSLAGKRGFPDSMPVPDQSPDKHPRDAKGWLTERRGRNQPYSPTVDQAALTNSMDLDLARANSNSFDKLCRDLIRLLTKTEPAK
jgi:hypothetical protein